VWPRHATQRAHTRPVRGDPLSRRVGEQRGQGDCLRGLVDGGRLHRRRRGDRISEPNSALARSRHAPNGENHVMGHERTPAPQKGSGPCRVGLPPRALRGWAGHARNVTRRRRSQRHRRKPRHVESQRLCISCSRMFGSGSVPR